MFNTRLLKQVLNTGVYINSINYLGASLPLGITDGHMTVRSGQMFSVMLTSDVST